MLASFGLLMKDTYIGWTEKNTEWPTVLTCGTQAERRRNRTPTHAIDVQSDTNGISQ